MGGIYIGLEGSLPYKVWAIKGAPVPLACELWEVDKGVGVLFRSNRELGRVNQAKPPDMQAP